MHTVQDKHFILNFCPLHLQVVNMGPFSRMLRHILSGVNSKYSRRSHRRHSRKTKYPDSFDDSSFEECLDILRRTNPIKSVKDA